MVTRHFCGIAAFLLAIGLSTVAVSPCPADSGEPGSDRRSVLSSASELDYPPFALVREDGTADGFSVDLLQAVCRVVGLTVTFKVAPWHEIKNQLANGQLDVLPLVARSAERDRVFDFTTPYLTMRSTIFVRKGESSIKDEADLKGREVLVMRDDMAHEYAVRRKVTDKLILTDSFEEALKRLSAGEHDAVIVQHLVGLQLIKKLGITNLVSVRSFLESSLKPAAYPHSGFEQKICIAVREGDKHLLAQLNEGLALVITEGVYDQLYDKWFGPILPQPAVKPAVIAKYLIYILVPVLALIGISSAWFLKREVARKTGIIRENEERLKIAQEIAHLGSWELDLPTNALTWSDEVYRIFGLEPQAYHANYDLFLRSIHPDDRRKVEDAYSASLQDRQKKYDVEHRVVRPDGTIRHVHEKCEHFGDSSGRIVRSVGMVHDITERKHAENALRDSESRLKASLAEKEVLLKEIHHRVKNNMQVISSLVDLQANEVADPAMHEIFQDVVHRVRSMAMVHEKLYQSPDLARVEFADYIRTLLGYLWRAQGGAGAGIRYDVDLAPVFLPVNQAVPCGLVINELFSNALKHAFTGRDSGQVTVSLQEDGSGRVRLQVRDDGIGLPAGFDWQTATSLGLRLVQMLSRQLKATVTVAGEAGTTVTLRF